MCVYVSHDVSVESEDNFQELILSFHRVGPRDQPQVFGLSGKYLYSLRHLSWLLVFVFLRQGLAV